MRFGRPANWMPTKATVLTMVIVASATFAATLYLTREWQPAPVGNSNLQPDQPTVNSHYLTDCSAKTTCTTTAIASVAYSTFVVMVGAASTTAPSGASISAGCTLGAAKGQYSTSSPEVYLYWCDNATAQASVTATVTFGSATSYQIMTLDIAKTTTISKDAIGTGAHGASKVPAGSVTTTVANDLVIEGVATLGTKDVTASGGDTVQNTSGVTTVMHGASVTQVDGTTGSITLSTGISVSATWSAIAFALKVAPVSPAPTALAAGTPTTTTVPLTWLNPKGPTLSETVYQATWSSGACGSYTTTYSVASQAQAYTVTGLTSGSAYCFEVTATNISGESAKSVALTDVLTASVPQAPTGLSVSPDLGTTGSVDLTWTDPPGTIANETVYRYAGASCAGTPTGTDTGGPGGNWDVNGLTAGTTYSFIVRAWNATGQGVGSSCAAGTTYALPAAPTSLGTTSQGKTSIGLSWSNPAGTILNDTVVYSTSSSCTTVGTVNIAGNASITALTVWALNQYTTYYFAVAAWTGGGEGAFTSCLGVTTLASKAGPATSFAVTSTAATTISVSWVVNPPASPATVLNLTAYLGTVCGTWTQHNSLASGSATTYTYTGLSTGTTYCLAVGEWDPAGLGPLAYTNGTTVGSAPSAPTGLAETAGSRTTISISWTNPGGGGLVNDTVYWTTAGNCAGTLSAQSTGGAIQTWTITGLTAFTTYHVAVTAWSAGGQSSQSSCVAMTSQAQTPPAPTWLNLTDSGATWIAFSWVNPSPYILYNNSVLYHAATCASFTQVSLAKVTSADNLTGLTPSTSYCIEVIAWDGPSNGSSPLRAMTLSTTGGGGGGGPPAPCVFNCDPKVNGTNATSGWTWFSWLTPSYLLLILVVSALVLAVLGIVWRVLWIGSAALFVVVLFVVLPTVLGTPVPWMP